MTINISNPLSNQISLPDPKKDQKVIKDLKKQQEEVKNIQKDINTSIKNIHKNLEDAFGKTAKLICLLRLDMIADHLENINPKWAHQIDNITNDFEKSIEV
jgi:Na+/phosphate symporter